VRATARTPAAGPRRPPDVATATTRRRAVEKDHAMTSRTLTNARPDPAGTPRDDRGRPLPRRPGGRRVSAPTPARTRARRRRTPDLERQSISFTVGLYLYICVALLLAHVTAGGA